MAYAGRIGYSDGVRVYITRNKNLIVDSIISIMYYAWNDKTMSKPGYGTKDLKIMAAFSPTNTSKEYSVEEFAMIRNSGNGSGDCELKRGDLLACGKVVNVEQKRDGDHQYNTVIIELNKEMYKKLEHTVTYLNYSSVVNDDKSYENIQGLLIEKPEL